MDTVGPWDSVSQVSSRRQTTSDKRRHEPQRHARVPSEFTSTSEQERRWRPDSTRVPRPVIYPPRSFHDDVDDDDGDSAMNISEREFTEGADEDRPRVELVSKTTIAVYKVTSPSPSHGSSGNSGGSLNVTVEEDEDDGTGRQIEVETAPSTTSRLSRIFDGGYEVESPPESKTTASDSDGGRKARSRHRRRRKTSQTSETIESSTSSKSTRFKSSIRTLSGNDREDQGGHPEQRGGERQKKPQRWLTYLAGGAYIGDRNGDLVKDGDRGLQLRRKTR